MNPTKTILIIGGGLMQVPAIRIARGMGLRVIVTDYNPQAPGLALADIPVIVSTRNIELTVANARILHSQSPIHGVLTVGTDASRTVAAVANALGLPGIRYEVAERATDKLKMRVCLQEKGVPIPKFYGVWNLEEAKTAAERLGFPLVIKPTDNMGARGVRMIRNREEVLTSFYEAKGSSVSGQIIMEEYMEGHELSIDALVWNSEIFITGVADRIIEYPPYFIETGHTMPSEIPKAQQEIACQVFKEAIQALGIDTGAAKGDIKIHNNQAKVGEVAARLSGGYMSAYTYPLSCGLEVIRGAIEIALGNQPSDLAVAPQADKEKFHKVSAERAIIPPPGKVLSISGIEEARKIPGVAEIFLHVQPNDNIHPPRSNMDKAANIITVADSHQEAIAINKKAADLIKIKTGQPAQIDLQTIKEQARRRFNFACKICPVCDGRECAGQVPGMGGISSGASFKANLEALAKYRLRTKTIHEFRQPDTSFMLWENKLFMPILAAPITGTKINMGGAIEEAEYIKAVINGCEAVGSLGLAGDGAGYEDFQIGLDAIAEQHGRGIIILKPREFNDEILKRIRAAEEAGVIAIGIDVDAAAFLTMKMQGQAVGPKSRADLEYLISECRLPFILKGIMTAEEAILAAEVGAAAIVVSNHGGRVLDYMPGAAEVLPEIVQALRAGGSSYSSPKNSMAAVLPPKNRAVPFIAQKKPLPAVRPLILIDGGIRNGLDVLKCLALGADAVLIGRPIAIAAVGGGAAGVEYILKKMQQELKEAMLLTGCPSLAEIAKDILLASK